jgi:hypothetical protein
MIDTGADPQPLVSDIDKRRRQRAAVRALTEILKRADKAKLKPIDWRLPGGLHVVGNIHSSTHGNVDQAVVDAFKSWCQLLCLTAADPVEKSGGGIYLAGTHTTWRPKPDVTGVQLTVIAQTFRL